MVLPDELCTWARRGKYMADTNILEQQEFMAIEKPASRISWGGIFIGLFSTLAIGILLLALGAAIGLTSINPSQGNWGSGIWTGAWSLLSIVVATFLGAMIAARASTLFFRKDAGSLGFMVWASSFLTMIFVVATIAGGALSQTAGVVGQAAGGALSGAGAAAQGETISPQAQQQIRERAQQALPTGPEAQKAASQVKEAGAVATWWFFASGLLAMIAGVLGGIVGMPKKLRTGKPLEVRRTAPLRTQETHA